MLIPRAIATAVDHRTRTGGSRVRSFYFNLLVGLTLTIALASFVRDRDHLVSNISFWLFLIPFFVSLWQTQVGFLVAIFLLTVTPSLHEQLNVLAGPALHAWTYPAVDCGLGFLAAWALRGGLRGIDNVLNRFPSGPLQLFHAWVALSAVIAVGRDIWQSASELSLRGLTYNVWLTRGISWHDDYYPLQDLFFYSAALAMLFGVWVLLSRGGERLLKGLVCVVLAGATTNVVFALWQKTTGLGWVNVVMGDWSISANAFWPDLHSFAGFMASALFLGYGFLVTRSSTSLVKTVICVGTLAAAVGLYLSGSRSTLFILFALLIAWAIWAVLKARGWRRTIPLIAVVAVLAAVHLTLVHGHRGISYASLGERLNVLDRESLNLGLSYRPEIWAAALRMYLEFPFFGLGQGAFYRLSAVPEFSGSEFLVSMRGEGVHNELLRILVELGPVGLGLVLFIAIPFARLGRQNFQWTSFYALAGIAIGNFYTNALLVRELLLLCAVFAGSYFWEVHSSGSARWRPPSPATTRFASISLLMLALAAFVEVALSLNKFPFTYGQRCFEVQPLTEDGWTQGVLRVPVPSGAASAELDVVADRPDLARRPLDLELSVLSESGSLLRTQKHVFTERESEPQELQLQMPVHHGKRFLEVRPSHCFVPLNLGITYDPRHLGVRLPELRFRTAEGVETR